MAVYQGEFIVLLFTLSMIEIRLQNTISLRSIATLYSLDNCTLLYWFIWEKLERNLEKLVNLEASGKR